MGKKNNYAKFLLLWAGELISSIGGGLTSFGLGVYIFDLTGSASGMALVTLLAFLPTIILSVPAGVLADRYDRRILMMLGDGLSGLGVLFILICFLTGGANMPEICIGVSISAVFSSLLEPSYRATITDILTKEEFSKASGMVSLAGSSRYLLSPLIAGLLLTVCDISVLLIIDICTFFITIVTTAVVRRGIEAEACGNNEDFKDSIKSGWEAVNGRKGLSTLIIMSSVITLFMGILQVLVEPMILSFESSRTLGIAETVCACGMLVSSLILGIVGIRKGYSGYLGMSLALAGIFMIGMSLFENMILICVFGFLFFAMLPVANSCLDYLTRTNIPVEKQGRAWGLIGFISQIGYVLAYAFSGIAADLLGKIGDRGVGRGAALMIFISGILLIVTSLMICGRSDIRTLEISPGDPIDQNGKATASS